MTLQLYILSAAMFGQAILPGLALLWLDGFRPGVWRDMYDHYCDERTISFIVYGQSVALFGFLLGLTA